MSSTPAGTCAYAKDASTDALVIFLARFLFATLVALSSSLGILLALCVRSRYNTISLNAIGDRVVQAIFATAAWFTCTWDKTRRSVAAAQPEQLRPSPSRLTTIILHRYTQHVITILTSGTSLAVGFYTPKMASMGPLIVTLPAILSILWGVIRDNKMKAEEMASLRKQIEALKSQLGQGIPEKEKEVEEGYEIISSGTDEAPKKK
jgi:small-conductance mechanosensitive channel